MTVPPQFSAEYVKESSPPEELLYADFLQSYGPYRSMMANNPWLRPPDVTQPLEWGTGRYWDTTVGRKHPYWSQHALPQPTKEIRQLRKDLLKWGYCLIEQGMSRAQCEAFYTRLWEQSEGEKLAGVHQASPTGQMVNTLVNKGECFRLCIEQHPKAVQAGPVIEQIMNETLGANWTCHSFLAIGSDPGGYPQGLHIDQAPLLPWLTVEAPALFNTMYIPEDVDDVNGGTLLIPGSHRILCAAGTTGEVGPMPPAINMEAPAGTIMLFDGRLLHGAGVNRSSKRRYVAVMSNVKPWMRTQENWQLSVAPDVLANASPKLRHRMGFQAFTSGSTVEGFGMGSRGAIGDVAGDIRPFRMALERGEYQRVGELSPESLATGPGKSYTLKQVQAQAKAARARRET